MAQKYNNKPKEESRVLLRRKDNSQWKNAEREAGISTSLSVAGFIRD
ncbi:MAG TPA: hypothetical protein VI413_06470 [Paludibacter sp.]